MKSGSAGAFRPGGPAFGTAPSHWLHGAGGRASRRAEPGVFQLLAKAKTLSPEGLATMMGELRSEHGRCPPEVTRDLFMSWNDIRDLASAGMEIGSHTVTHPILGLVDDPAVLRRELADSKRVLEEKVGKPIKAFSYPVGGQKGDWSRVTDMTKETGYQYACLYTSDRNHIPISDWFNLSRIRVEAGDSFARFRAKVLFPGIVRY